MSNTDGRLFDYLDAWFSARPVVGDGGAFIRADVVDEQQFPFTERLFGDAPDGDIERGGCVAKREKDGDHESELSQ